MSETDELIAYVYRPDTVCRWKNRGRTRSASGNCFDVRMTSQVWQGRPWEHHLQVFVPDQVAFPGTALLYVTGGARGTEETQVGEFLAQATGVVCAVLYQVPNQPLFEGRVEDELIAYTFQQYLDSGDPDWPLLFPMVKAAVQAMDALEAFSRQEKAVPLLSRFVVAGASKRGWTAWLTAVADDRVAAILPMVYDNLNLTAQMRHQVEVWGGYSEQIHDYTEQGLQEQLASEHGQRLARMVDPYTYLDRLTLPKLLMNGANDRYWATDALNLYWDALPGPKWLLYVPNSGHGLNDLERVFGTSVAFIRAIASGSALPELTWNFGEAGEMLRLTLQAAGPAKEAQVWIARAPTQDFRDATWHAMPMREEAAEDGTHRRFALDLARPAMGFLMAFGEVRFEQDSIPYTLSTQIHVARNP